MKKIAYVGIDFLDEALKSLLARDDIEILKIFTCNCDNKTEFNLEVNEIANINCIPITTDRITIDDLNELYSNGCDMLICAGYYYKIPVFDLFPMVNIHPALLPLGRGPWPMPVTILKGLKKSGVTIHKITDKLDEGDILLSDSFEVSDKENLVSIMSKDSDCIRKLIPKLIDNFDELYRNAIKQKDGEYWESPIKKDYTINLMMSDNQIDLILRAFLSYEVYLDMQDGSCFELIGGRLVQEPPVNCEYFKTREGSYIISDKLNKVN